MVVRFDTVTIVGVGLLGGSLGLALKKRGLAKRILGVGHRPETLNTAQQRGLIDQGFSSAVDTVPESDLIVLCTPAAKVPEYLDTIRGLCRKGAVVTDVASTKRDICVHVRKAWSAPYRFVGSHPMAGSEKFGPEHASETLYENSICFVETLNGHAPDAHAAVSDLWTAVGAQVVPIDPAAHDTLAARTSHVPHIVAAALARLTAKDGDALRAFVGGGFRDTTRIAEGRPELWRDISLTNADAVLGVLKELQADLAGFSDALSKNDAAALEKYFTEGRDARRRMFEA